MNKAARNKLSKQIHAVDRAIFNAKSQTEKKILKEIREKLDALQVSFEFRSKSEKVRLKEIKAEITRLTREVMDKYQDEWVDEVVELGYRNGIEYEKVLGMAVVPKKMFIAPVLLPNRLKYFEAVVSRIDPKTGMNIERTYRSFEKWFTKRNMNKINALHLEGLTTHNIVKEAGRSLIPRNTVKQFRTLFNTGISLARETSREIVEKDYEKYIDAYEYSAFLDASTTEYCRMNNGKVFKTKAAAAKAGVAIMSHYNCRSVWIPIPKEL